MSVHQQSPAIAVARDHIEAWSNHDFDTARAALAPDVHVTATTVDPGMPVTDLSGIEAYMQGLVEFTQGVLPGTTEVTSCVGDDTRALVRVTSQVKFGPDAPEMTLHGARLYLLDANHKIKDEQVIFFVTAG